MLPNDNRLLLDVSLTGGRGPAKKAYELIMDLRDNSIPFAVISDRRFAQKLREMGIQPDYVVDTDLSEPSSLIIQKFDAMVRSIKFGLLVKFGARVAGPIAARKMSKPYILVDGGLPDYLTEEESLYERRTFQQASRVFLTSQFPCRFPGRSGLKNIEVVSFPLSGKTFQRLITLSLQSKISICKSVAKEVSGNLPNSPEDLLINLVMTGDYFNTKNRVAYGGWLTAPQYDQCVGFVRRLITDIGEQVINKKVFIFLDNEVKQIVTDLAEFYSNISFITFNQTWNYQVELAMQAAADVTISRATNYQPYIAALAKGGSITTPVPADGYMDEDSAAIQYQDQGLTKFIPYNEENYMVQLMIFLNDKKSQQNIARCLKANLKYMKKNNLNQLLIQLWNKLGNS